MRKRTTTITLCAALAAGYAVYDGGADDARRRPVAPAVQTTAPNLAPTPALSGTAPGPQAASPAPSPSGASATAPRAASSSAAATPAVVAPSPAAAPDPGRLAEARALLAKDQPLEAAISAAAVRRFRAGVGEPKAEDAAAIALLTELERKGVTAANEAAAKGDASEQRRHLTLAYVATPDAGRRAMYGGILTDLAEAEIFSKKPSKDAASHVVKPGESLGKISKACGFPVEGLCRINGLAAPEKLRAGQTLKLPTGPIRIVAFKSEFKLVCLAADRFLTEIAVGIGKDDCTPEATFVIEEREVSPTWYAPDGVFPPGDPRNILGTRWLGFNDTPEHKGFGIHGTAYPESIGKAESSGCLRLRNEDVERLFGFVPKGAKVTIVP